MAKQAAKAVVPRLRFPEFRENGAWKPTRLDSVLKFQVGFPFPSKGFSEEILGLRLIRNRDLRSNDKPIYFIGPYSPDFVVSDGDVLVGMDGDFTPCVWNGGDALLNQRVGRVLPRAENNKRFMFYFLTAQLKKIEESTARTTVKHLSHSDVERICEPLPHGEEQKKIADCLTSLDEVIAAQGRKVEALKTHRRGLIQQLFPREGETRPRLRFPEFHDAPEWEERPLGDVATFFNGRAYAKDELLGSGKYPVLRVGNFFTNDRWYYSDLELEENKYCTNGDLLYAWSASFGPRIWRGGRVIFHYHIWKVIEGHGVNRVFLFYRLDSETERMKDEAANGIGMFHITKGTIEGWMSSFPGISEQQRIADCLSFFDSQIAAETNQLAALKTHKHGLMQQLFPAQEA